MSVAEAVQTTAKAPSRQTAGLLLQRKCACDGSAGLTNECSDCRTKKLLGRSLQTRLRVNEPGDEYEREADRVAEQVMRMPDLPAGRDTTPNQAAPLVQRSVNGAAATGIGAAPPIVHEVLSTPGQPLDAATRAFFEPRFRHDFGHVRVHMDAKAVESAKAINALGYTVAPHVVLSSTTMHNLIAHELSHVVQQSQTSRPTLAPSIALRGIHIERAEESRLGSPYGGQLFQQTEAALLQRSPTPTQLKKKPSLTDEDLLQLLDPLPSGEPIILYHVDENGGVLRNIQEHGRNFSLNRSGEFYLTTNVETRAGFKSGAGLNNIIAFYLDRRFVQLLGEAAVTQRVAGMVERFFNKVIGKHLAKERGMKAGEVLALPRFNFEGGGPGQGRALRVTQDFNIALRSFKGVNEWNRLFRLSIQQIDHLQYNESLPAGSRLVHMAQLYPLSTGLIGVSDPLLPGPVSGSMSPLQGPTSGSSESRQLPAPLPVYEPITLPQSLRPPIRGLLPGPVSGATPLLTGPISGSSESRQLPAPLPVYEPITLPQSLRPPIRGLLPGPVSGATPLLTGPISGSSESRQLPAPLPVYEPITLPQSLRPPIRGLLPGPVSGATPLLTGPISGSSESRQLPAPLPVNEPITLPQSQRPPVRGLLPGPVSGVPPQSLGIESGAAPYALLGGALLANVMARKLADAVAKIETQKAHDAVNQLVPQILSELEKQPEMGVIITVAYSQPIPDLFGLDPEVPRTFRWASFDIVPGRTLSEAQSQSRFDTLYPVPNVGELHDYRYQWIPPIDSPESPQNWHSVQWSQSKGLLQRLHEWLQGK